MTEFINPDNEPDSGYFQTFSSPDSRDKKFLGIRIKTFGTLSIFLDLNLTRILWQVENCVKKFKINSTIGYSVP